MGHPPGLTVSNNTQAFGKRGSHDQKGVTHMLTVFWCGALITAVAASGASIRLSDPETAVTPLTRVAVAVLAGALWPVIAVGALLLIALVPFVESLGTAPKTKTEASPPTGGELVLAG